MTERERRLRQRIDTVSEERNRALAKVSRLQRILVMALQRDLIDVPAGTSVCPECGQLKHLRARMCMACRPLSEEFKSRMGRRAA